MTTCSTKHTMGIDIETYSSADIGGGAYAYASAPDFEVLLIAYCMDNGPVQVHDCTEPGCWPRDLLDALTDPETIKTAYNANFERTCLSAALGEEMPPEQWRCTMIMASSLGLPRSLADVGKAMGLPQDAQKDKTGKALIQYFCKPCKPTRANGGRTRNLPMHAPDKWQLFKEYNRQDVVAEQAIREALLKYAPDQAEQDLWTLDQQINDRGVMLDTDLAQRIVWYDTTRSTELAEEARRITGLSNPNSLPQLKGWLNDQGIPVDTLNKGDVADMLAGQCKDNVRRVLEIRQALGKSSVKKYQTMLEIADPEDNRARGIMQFYGGHTGRWAGRSLQPQNLVRNTMPDAELDAARDLIKTGNIDSVETIFGEPSTVFSQLVRTAFIPSDGRRFVVSDFSAIEARVIAWIAGEQWRLDVFRQGGDIYCESASRMYHVPVEKHGQNAELRQRGKVAELALGYGGSVGAIRQMDSSGAIPEDEISAIVQKWRAESPHIVAMWKACQSAAVSVINGEQPKRIIRALQGLSFYRDTVAGYPVLFIGLPSGRPIAYWDPQVMETDMGPRITYMTQNQTTRKWERCETYGGKLTENIVQSVARDCLAEKMLQMDAQGYDIVFHVHDEIVLDVPRTDKTAAETIDRIMGEPIDWAPDLPLKGGTYECDFYRKD